MEQLVRMVPAKRSEDRLSKTLADFDYESLRRLERTRVLVRAGPALGLMGTLIPLAPGLAALAEGNVQELTLDLRLAFSITIVGLLIGAVAFGISLVRDRLYGQDLSDLEYMVAMIAPGDEAVTETELVRTLGRARRRPGRHSRPDDDDEDAAGGPTPYGPVRPPQVLPAAADTPGAGAGEATAAMTPGAADAEPPGTGPGAGARSPSDDDRDYLAELTAGLATTFDESPDNGPPATSDRPGTASRGDGSTPKNTGDGRGARPAADEEERR